MNIKNILLVILLQLPLLYFLVYGVYYLTGMNIWLCFLIAGVLNGFYDFGERIRKGE